MKTIFNLFDHPEFAWSVFGFALCVLIVLISNGASNLHIFIQFIATVILLRAALKSMEKNEEEEE